MGLDLSKRSQDIEASATLEITAKAKKLKESGIDIVSFGAGEPDFDTPDYIKEAAVKAINAGFTKYTPASGTNELRLAISEKFKRDNGLNYLPEQIVVSCGAKHSLYNIFQVICDADDEVIIPAPYWISYPEMVKMASAKPVFVRTRVDDNFKLRPKELEQAVTSKTKAIIINSPSNPTGSVYQEKELQIVADIALKHKIWVISDEIYEDIIYGDKKHISIASLGKDIYDLTVTVNGLSKSYSMTGWRIGYLGAPLKISKAVGNLQSHSTSNPASISQKASLAALQGDKEFIKKMVSEFKVRRDYMVAKLKSIKGFSPFNPDGAFYVFCDISDLKLKAAVLANRLLEEARVAVVPGEGFGFDTYIRFSFATGIDQIKKGLERIEQWAKQL